MKTIQDRALEWLFSGDTGLSSKAICKKMLGVDGECNDYPHDPSDLGRCLRLLEVIPEWKQRIGEMAGCSAGWSGIVSKWDELSAAMTDEVGIDWSKGRSAPNTFKAMKLAIAKGYRNDERYDCKFSSDGYLSSAIIKDEFYQEREE